MEYKNDPGVHIVQFLFVGLVLTFIATSFIAGSNNSTFIPSAHAQTPCHILDSSRSVPAGWGAAYNVLSSAKELLINVICHSSSAQISVGNGSQTQYVYENGYRWNGSTWEQFKYSGQNIAGSPWLVGQGSYVMSLSSAQLSETNYIVTFICDWTGTQWKCGCNNSACTQPAWNLQAFKMELPSAPPPPDTGGGDRNESVLILERTFDDGSLGIGCSGICPSVVSSPTRRGAGAMRSEVNFQQRSEISTDYNAPHGVDHWYGVSIFMPSDFQVDPTWEQIINVHGVPDFDLGENWRNGMTGLFLRSEGGGRYNFSVRYDSNRVTVGKSPSRSFDLGPIDRGRWVDWVMHVRWSPNSDGLMELWKDGQQVVSFTGPTAYNDATGPYWKMGLYGASGVGNHVIYHDELRIARGSAAKYADVAP